MKRLILVTSLLVWTAVTASFAQPEAQPGGSITVSIIAEPPGWDPTVSTSQEIARVMYHNVFEGLVRIDRNGDIVPALAAKWETSADGLTWTFTLQDGVTFHNGDPLTPADVVAALKRAADPESGHTHPEYYEAIEDVKAEGNTVVLTLSKPTSSLLYNLARPDSIIYQAGTQAAQASEPVGTGPFRFAQWVRGSEVKLTKYPDYYSTPAYLDAVTFRIIEDTNAQLAALQAGDLDMVGVALSPENAIQLKGDPNIKVTEGSATTEITLALNNTRKPLDNPLVRQAITHAVDKETIVKGAMFGYGTVIGTHSSPIEPYYEALNPYPYDPERAKSLLAEAGYPNGFTINFELPPYPFEKRTGEVIAQQLSEVGIKVNLTNVEWTTWLDRIFTQGDYDMTIIGHSEPRDIGIYGNPDYYFHYNSQRVQDLLAQIEKTSDEAEQMSLYKEIERTIAKDAVNVWVFSPPYLVAARNDLYGYWQDQPIVAVDLTEAYLAQ